jgi:hypothetical protein
VEPFSAKRDVKVIRYGGDADSPEGGEALFLADRARFEAEGPPGGIDILDRYEADELWVRIRRGELAGQESDEWITCRSFSLTAPSGSIVLGSWFPCFYGDDAPYVHPPWWTPLDGIERTSAVAVYTYLPFLVARGGLIEAMSLPEAHEVLRPWGRWFRETRPGVDMPVWLARECADWPGIDPGHEEEWADRECPAAAPVVEVLIQLFSDGEYPPPDAERELAVFPEGILAHQE